MANKKFTSIPNDFCITFDRNTTIDEVCNDDSIGAQGFSFVTIDAINDFEQNRTVDAVGVIINSGTLSSFQPKNGAPPKDRRAVAIADESGLSITLTLWGNNASMHSYNEG